jgi:hypothetical protein
MAGKLRCAIQLPPARRVQHQSTIGGGGDRPGCPENDRQSSVIREKEKERIVNKEGTQSVKNRDRDNNRKTKSSATNKED